MQIANLGYVGFDARDLDGWRRFAERLLGMQVVETAMPAGGKALALRMDERCHRILVRGAEQDGNPCFGLEFAGTDELAAARNELERRGLATTAATPEELALRRIDEMFHIADPMGYRLEFYRGLAKEGPLSAPRPVGGFRTGELGFGHVVLRTRNLDEAQDFYCDVLGFRVSDYVLTPNRRVFMHINARHHSMAFAEAPALGIAHIMVEANQFDDVGRAYDVALRDYPERINSTLGRHSNDLITSFYVESPNGVVVEYGWGGLLVDDATWEVKNVFGPSLWGHDRAGLSEQSRRERDAQRQYAFDHGLNAPIQVRAEPDAFDLGALERKRR
jgi:2,3-dihydroxybiphenyl 1,2-dioxygenase